MDNINNAADTDIQKASGLVMDPKANDWDVDDTEEEKKVGLVSRDQVVSVLLYIVLAGSVIAAGYFIWNFTVACMYPDHELMANVYLILAIWLADIAALMISSAISYWNYDHRKKMFLGVIITYFGLLLFEMTYKLAYAVAVPLLVLPEPNRWVTVDDWMFLIRAVPLCVALVITVLKVQDMWCFLFSRVPFWMIKRFRILDHIDMRGNIGRHYDAGIVRKIQNGHKVVVREKDRFLHWLIIGVTGTGKTSAMLLPMIHQDLRRRCRIEDHLKKLLYKGLERDEYKLKGAMPDYGLDLSLFEGVNPKAEKKLKQLIKQHPLCGITVFAPDDSLTDSVYSLCRAMGIRCNRIDPIKDGRTGRFKQGFMGYNPLQLSKDIPDWKIEDETCAVAGRVSDVIYKLSYALGSQQFYFSSIILDLLKATIICLMVAVPVVCGRQPTLLDVKDVVGDFPKIKPYLNALKDICRGTDMQGYINAAETIDKNFFGKDCEDIYKHSRGLRTLLDMLLNSSSIRAILCPPEDRSVDMDRMFREGQVTVINYALETDERDAKNLGTLLLLSVIASALRRPRAEGVCTYPHFLIIDELPVIVSPAYEKALSLLRKFGVGIVSCIQSLAQFEQDPSIKYIKDLVAGGSANITGFGRCTIDVIKMLCDIGGITYEEDELKTLMVTDKDTGESIRSETTLESLKPVNAIDGTELRYKLMGEVTMIPVRNGNLLPPIDGKVDYLPDKKWRKLRRPEYYWFEHVPLGSGVGSQIREEKSHSQDNRNDHERKISLFAGYKGRSKTEEIEDEDAKYEDNSGSGGLTI